MSFRVQGSRPSGALTSQLQSTSRKWERSFDCAQDDSLLLNGTPMIRPAFFLFLCVHPAVAALDRYSDLIVADSPNRPLDHESIRITYLGTNGYQLETAGHAILIDPYITRISLARAVLGWSVRADEARINEAMTHLTREVDAILITHAHFDHLLDAPSIMNRTGARLIGSETAVELASRAGADRDKCTVVRPGVLRRIGPWRITALPASHDRLWMMGVPFNGPVTGNTAPRRASDWVCGEPLSYLIAANGLTIFIDSGGTPSVVPGSNVGPVDLAILGMALPDSRARFAATVTALHPRYLLPSHQDNFFRPLDRGFQFGPLTDFSFVRREHQIRRLPGRLILLDYFRPWTLTRR
jgi:L-ascorbate metabolism protein UlaG (beta-lactamase superfamily)